MRHIFLPDPLLLMPFDAIEYRQGQRRIPEDSDLFVTAERASDLTECPQFVDVKELKRSPFSTHPIEGIAAAQC